MKDKEFAVVRKKLDKTQKKLAQKGKSIEARKPCWTIKKCPTERREQCPAWEFQAGKFCWFINGTICECVTHSKWENKMDVCQKCEVFSSLVPIESVQ